MTYIFRHPLKPFLCLDGHFRRVERKSNFDYAGYKDLSECKKELKARAKLSGEKVRIGKNYIALKNSNDITFITG